jgi:two-component system sensor histidine kinase KdpD
LAAERRLDDLRATLESSLPRNLVAPLTALLGLSAFLRNEGASVPPELICEVGQGIVEGSQRFQRALEKIVLYADLERQARATQTTPALTAERQAQTGAIVTEGALAMAGALDRRAGLTLEVDDVLVRIDPAHLRRLVLELVENAIKYSAGGRPVSVECRRDGDSTCRLTISDQGPGLPHELSAGANAPLAGHWPDDAGFGLAIVRRIVSLHGARFSLAPASSGGMIAVVELPVVA